MDVIPIKALFDKQGKLNVKSAVRSALLEADVIIGVDVASQRQFTVFGTPAFEETVRVGTDVAMHTVRVEIDEQAGELNRLVELVQSIKGRPST